MRITTLALTLCAAQTLVRVYVVSARFGPVPAEPTPLVHHP